jgi:dihydrofolate reductase
MKVIMYMAVSADGFIADKNDQTPWSDDEWQAFESFVKSCDVVLIGRRTYQIMKDEGSLVDGPQYVVASRHPDFDTGDLPKISIDSKADLPRAEKLGVIGGGELNGSVAKLGAIDEVILDVEPIVLGEGKRLFGSHDLRLELELVDVSKIGESTIHNRYKVLG